MKKNLLIGIGAAVVIGGALVGALMLQPAAPAAAPTMENNQEMSPDVAADQNTDVLLAGRYQPYDEQSVAATGYNETILFFHASWCPECRAFEQAIEQSDIPDGVQILKLNYDSEIELRQKYGVTLQSTFVSVDNSGEKISTWVGYGKDKSVNAILENT